MNDIDVGKVAMVPLESIKIGDRARQEMGDLNEIEESMRASGLISPLAVKEVDYLEDYDCQYFLLAGERRLCVLRKNNIEVVPVRIYPSTISDIEVKIIEKAENFYRKDLEYWEYDNLVRDIHLMQQEIHGTKAPGPDQTGWSTEDTGEMMGGISKASVSTAIKRADARDAFPELFDTCKTQKDASNLIKKMDEALIKEVLAKKLELNATDSTTRQLANSFILRDFFEGVKEIPDGIMHLVEIDPPYSIGLMDLKKKEGESIYDKDSYNEVADCDYIGFLGDTFRSCYRVMADHSWLICWFAPEPWFELIYAALLSAGFSATRMCGIWTKPGGQSLHPEMYLANCYEMFFYAWKGRPAINKAGRKNEFEFSPIPPNQKTHPTERPVELMREIYDTFAFPGSRILIPFLGSGSGLIAANQLGMSGVGFELSKSYKDSFLVKIHKNVPEMIQNSLFNN